MAAEKKLIHNKFIRLGIVLLIVAGMFLLYYLSEAPKPETDLDKKKQSNTQITGTLAKDFCQKHNRCPNSLDELFESGATGPYESYNVADYTYELIDNGKDCVITTALSSGQKYVELCVGENLENIKYLKNSKSH